MPEQITINTPMGKIAALAWGPTCGERVLATHGWLDNAASFSRLAPLLPDYRIIAFDLPGHGLSQHRPQRAYFHFVDYLADTLLLLDALEWDSCKLLGHSLGACIFSLVAGIAPERFSHIACIDALGPFSIEPDQMSELVTQAVTQYGTLESKIIPRYMTIDAAVKARLKASDMLESSVRTLVERGIVEKDAMYEWRTDPRLMLKPLIMFTEAQVQALLKKITAKACLIRPDSGWPFNKVMYANRIACVPKLEVKRIPGKHHVHLDEPEQVATIVQNFFQGE